MSRFVNDLSHQRAPLYTTAMDSTRVILETPTRTRTRHAILQTAVGVLAQTPAASLGEIADAAGVARSTLHRYYPERTDLIEALEAFAADEIEAATARARLDEGLAAAALVRLCHEYFDLWETLMWSYLESLRQNPESCAIDDQLDPAMTALIARGHADGTIDARVPNAWLQRVVWALLYSAWEYARQGGIRHEALTLMLGTIERMIAPVAAPD